VCKGDIIVVEFLQANWLTVLLLTAIVAMFVLLRNRATQISALDETVGNGQPVIVEVFSNT
jgi:hypothetical protein